MKPLLDALAGPWPLRVLRTAVGFVFVISGIAKIGDIAWFAQQVHNFRLAPEWFEHAIALALPWVELVAGLALILGIRARAGAAVAFALMLVFTVAVGAAWARGLDFRCGCFGKAGAATIGAAKFAENAGLTLIAALAMRRRRLPPRA